LQVRQHKGYVSESGGIIRVTDEHMKRFAALLEESGDRPTCLVMHVPLIWMADRIHARGCYDQVRYMEEVQIRALVNSRKNVKLVLSGHQHFNQVEEVRGALHCVTQGVRGYPPYRDPDGIRIVEIRGATIRGYMTWDGAAAEPPGLLGTLDGDRSFEWRFADA